MANPQKNDYITCRFCCGFPVDFHPATMMKFVVNICDKSATCSDFHMEKVCSMGISSLKSCPHVKFATNLQHLNLALKGLYRVEKLSRKESSFQGLQVNVAIPGTEQERWCFFNKIVPVQKKGSVFVQHKS